MFDERLPDEVERARRYGTPLCIVVFDVDYFKSVNDAFGHLRGDAVLRELVQRVQAAIRSSDILFRYGGDEFAIVLPNTSRASGAVVAQRVLEAVTSGPFLGHPPLSVSVSIGLAVFPDDATAARALFESADYRNLLAKRSGRGCVVSEGLKLPSDRPLQESSRLIERDEALERGQSFLDAVASGSRSVMRIAGSSGSGKTRLLSEVIAAARLRNALVVHLRGSRSAKARPYGVWLENAPTTLPPPETGEVKALARALEEARIAHDHTAVVVACDDLPDFDFSTFELVSRLLGAPEFRRLGVVFTADRRSARTLAGPPQVVHEDVDLGALSLEGTLVWLRSTMQWEAPPDFVRWIHESTAGAPGKLQQAILILRERGVLHRGTGHTWTLDAAYVSTPLSQKLRGASLLPDRALPPALTDFVGREVEQERINALLDRSRLVSLVGPGGIGKTRLSLQIARGRTDDFADGVRFVSLGSTMDPALVAPAVASALGVRQSPGKSVRESLVSSLRDKEMLLVLDNFEQVVDAAPFVSELLTEASHIRILVTSREALHVSGEHVYPVPPLPLPDPGAIGTDDALRSPAVTLFATRAQAANFDFALTRENARDVAELCRRLDGLPLAIEIAAARIDQVTPRDMLESDELLLDTAGPRDLPHRQKTLHNVIDWSYSRLDRASQVVFSRLAVFAGSASPEAVAAVCDADDLGGALARALSSLSDKCLVVSETPDGGEARTGMLATIRAFALDKLRESGEERVTRDRHAAYYTTLAVRLATEIGSGAQRATLHRFDREHANLLAALAHLQGGAPDAAATLALALGRFWEKRGHWTEGFDWLDALTTNSSLDVRLRARCLHFAARLARLQSEPDVAVARLEEAKALAEARGDAALLASIDYDLGCVAMALRSDYAAARQLLIESLALFRKVRDDLGGADALAKLGLLAYTQADHDGAERLCNEALALARRRGDPGITCAVVSVLGLVARARGDYATAAALFEESLSTCEWLDDKFGTMDALWSLAEFARSRGDLEKASATYQRYMALCREVGNAPGTAIALKDLGEIARYAGRYDEAATLYERARRLLEATGTVSDIPWVLRNQAEVALHRGQLAGAGRSYRAALRQHGGETHPLLLLLCAIGLAAISTLEGDLERAARLVGAAERLFEADGALLALYDRDDYYRRVALVKERLDPHEFEAGRAAGRRLAPADVVTLCLSPESG
jgi:diguanylate cyclase (GGDEF)-like protein